MKRGLFLLLTVVFLGCPEGLFGAQAGGSPAELQGVRFYDRDFVAAVQSGTFDPFEFVDHRPVSVYFPGPGQIQIDWGQEVESCSLTAAGGPNEFSLVMLCGGQPKAAHWTWIETGRVRTDVAYDEPGTMIEWSQTFEQICEAHSRAYAAKKMPELAGSYKDLDGHLAVLGTDGSLTLDGARYDVAVQECLNRSGPAAMPHVPCLRLQGGGQSLLLGALPADAGAVLVEGTLLQGEDSPDGPAFVPKPKGDRYFREL